MKKLIVFCVALFTLTACTTVPKPESVVGQLKIARTGHAAVAIGTKIYVLGGSNAKGYINKIEVFDTETGDISPLPSHLLPRSQFSAVWDGQDSIYIMGGLAKKRGRYGFARWVEVLNIHTGDVSYAPDLPEPAHLNTALKIGDEIWVFGGQTLRAKHLQYSNKVAIYSLKDRAWHPGPKMTSSREVKSAELNGEVYFVGGYDGWRPNRNVERLDPTDSKWHSEHNLPMDTSANALASCDNALVSFGDYNQMDRILRWQEGSSEWQQVQLSMQPARHAVAVRVKDDLYVIGGNAGSRGPYVRTIQRFNCAEIAASTAS